ncbi:MAG: 1-deoxy-D-xylulose-5-phosphate reductoisomerase [Paracoccaceae bacterium]|nr:1-deoxy-D-xylulose-5-phosphate reductoisomerase [Paracoccaceae bacterium]
MSFNSKVSEVMTVNIFGVTGSIGRSTLDVINYQSLRDQIKVNALSANNNVELLAQHSIKYKADYAVIVNPDKYKELKNALFGSNVSPLAGSDCLIEMADKGADWTMNAIVGFAGLEPSVASARTGKILALANKESLVCGGDLLNATINKYGSTLLPVDSEHSAVFQCLKNESRDSVEKIILTASGGPFREWSIPRIRNATVEQAIAHPNWDMGAKISIDSATMFNKALEIIEAKYLFNLSIDDIEVLVHPESILHSMVNFCDGSVIAQLSVPDMQGAIGYALNYPKRCALPIKRLALDQIGSLTFEAVDQEKFPALKLAYLSLQRGALFGAVLNAAKEIALDKFIDGEIKFLDITSLVEAVLDSKEILSLEGKDADTFEDIVQADLLSRDIARTIRLN